MPQTGHDVAIAFAVVIAAGAATAIGASVVFFPQLVKLASRRVLAGSLGFSAGVMTYVSFVEIYQKGVDSLSESHSENNAKIYATLGFFGGVLLMMLIDVAVKKLSGEDHHHHEHYPSQFQHHHHDHHHAHEHQKTESTKRLELTNERSQQSEQGEIIIPHCIGCSPDPVAELTEWQLRALEEVNRDASITQEKENSSDDDESHYNQNHTNTANKDNNNSSQHHNDEEMNHNHSHDHTHEYQQPNNEENNSTTHNEDNINIEIPPHIHEDKRLVRMGLGTAAAISLHNFPEGLATYVAVIQDAKVGAVLAIAIAIHNIPEGLCVALPVYYATGNRTKAFLWGMLSGLSEPIGALLGWLVLANTVSSTTYGIMFAIISGMMVIISLKELLPTAHRYDPCDTVTTYCLIAGFVIMAVSLMLFLL